MSYSNELSDCSPAELQALVQIVRLAAELHSKQLLSADCANMIDAIVETAFLLEPAASVIADDPDEGDGNN
jgi:hypothetical protein